MKLKKIIKNVIEVIVGLGILMIAILITEKIQELANVRLPDAFNFITVLGIFGFLILGIGGIIGVIKR